ALPSSSARASHPPPLFPYTTLFRSHHADLRILADTSLAIPMLSGLLKGRAKSDKSYAASVAARSTEIARQSNAKRERWAKEAREHWDASPIALPRLASEVWDAIKGEDWVLTAGTLDEWA